MNIISKILVIIILGLDIYLFNSLRKNKLKVCGKNPLAAISQTAVAFFVIVVLVTKSLSITNILLIFVLSIYLLFGNGSGICSEGVVSNSMLISWDKIERFSIQDENDKKVFVYYVKDTEKRIIFNKEDQNDLIEAVKPIEKKQTKKVKNI